MEQQHPTIPAGFCTLAYDEETDCLLVTWQGALGPQEAQRGAQQALEALAKHRATCVLNDNSRVLVMWFETLHWMEQHWAPIAATYGLRHLAHVTHPSVYHTVVEVAMQYNFSPYFELQLFDDAREGREWLRHCYQQETNRC